MSDSIGKGINDVIQDAMRGVHRALEEAGVEPGEEDGGPREALEREFEVGPGPELSVGNVSGEITVRGESRSSIHIRAAKRGSRARTAGTEVTFTHDGNRVSVGTKGSAGGMLALGRGIGRVDFDIEVPLDCSVHVHTVSGEVHVFDIDASVAIESVSGDVEVRQVSGDLSTTTVSGEMSARRVTGTLVARTTSGDIEVKESTFQRFNLNSVSGDFSIETPLSVDQQYFAKTVSGDMELRVPPSTGVMVQLHTTSGDVNCQLPAEVIKSSRRHWQGRVNGGGALLEMHSVSGDLTIGRGRDVDAVDSVPAAEPVSVQVAPPAIQWRG